MDRKAARITLIAALVTMFAGLGVLFAPSAQANIITVNVGEDLAPLNDGDCTLREAITNANNDSTPYDGELLVGECAAGSGLDMIVFVDPIVDPSTSAPTSRTITLTIAAVAEDDDNTAGDLDITDPDGLIIDAADIQTTVEQTVPSERVFERHAGDLTFKDLVVTGGAATFLPAFDDGNGGGLAARLPGSGDSDVTIVNTKFTGNTADGPTAGADGGGGLWFEGDALDIDDSAFVANHANGVAGSGGGIFVVDGTVTIDGSDVGTDTVDGGNSANRAGGGIEIVAGSLTITDSGITNNAADGEGAGPGNGGGIHVTGGTVTVRGGSTVIGNEAASEGGGLWNNAGFTMTVDGSTVDGNEAAGAVAPDAAVPETGNGGGGIFNDGGTLVVEGGSLIGDPAGAGNDATGAAGSGGGIFSTGGSVTVTGSTVANNTAPRAGGGIELVAGSLTLTGSEITDNKATGFQAGPGNGGGVHVTGGTTVTVDGASNVLRNTADSEGGGLWNAAGVTMTVDGSTVDGNEAEGAVAPDPAVPETGNGGGGIFNDGGTLVVKGGSLIGDPAGAGNDATGAAGSGGGIFSTGGSVTVTGSTVANNTAPRAGGGIEIVAGSLTVTGSEITDNEATGGGAPGNGGGVHVTGGTTVTVDGASNVLRNTADSEGGGLWNAAGVTMTIDAGSMVDGNNAEGAVAPDPAVPETGNGGGGIFNDGGTLVVKGGSLIGGLAGAGNHATGAAGSGGGIFSTGGSVTVTDSTVANNTAPRAGGGIEIVDGSLTLDGAEVRDNEATGAGSAPGNGGGVHITDSDADVVVKGASEVLGNTAASEGGGLWNAAGVTMIIEGASVVDGNEAMGSTVPVLPGETGNGGGGIFNNGGTLEITGGSMIGDPEGEGNHATGEDGLGRGSGGGIFSIGGTVTVTGSTVANNDAKRAGGGIELVGGTLTVIDSAIQGNDADAGGGIHPGDGGGVHVTAGTVTVKDNSVVSGNRAARSGGGLWNEAAFTMTIDSSEVVDNLAEGPETADGGGGVYNHGGALKIVEASNIGLGPDAGNVAISAGGGIYSSGGTVEVTGGSAVDANQAGSTGGGIEIAGGSLPVSLLVDDASITGNEAGGAAGDGGGIHLKAGAVIVEGGSGIADNTATRSGGGIWIAAGKTATIDDSTVSGNVANGASAPNLSADPQVTGMGGGGIYNDGGTLKVQNGSSLNENSAVGAAGSGGGIYTTGGTVTVSGMSSLGANTGNRAGGGIEVVGGAVIVDTSTVRDNEAGGGDGPGNGGGIHVTKGDVTVKNQSDVIGNSADSEGGGLWNNADSTMTVEQSVVDNNVAEGDDDTNGGGGIFNNGGTLVVKSASVIGGDEGNDATGDGGAGGGIFSTGGEVTISGSSVVDNDANRAGGGIAITGGDLTLGLSAVNGNHADGEEDGPGDGGGLHHSGTGEVDITDSTFDLNEADANGGGIWDAGLGELVVDSSTLRRNTAGGAGGGIFHGGGETGSVEAVNSTLTANIAEAGGGAAAKIPDLIPVLNTVQTAGPPANNFISSFALAFQNQLPFVIIPPPPIEFDLTHATVTRNSGGGLVQAGRMTATNSVIADQSNGDDCDDEIGTQLGQNLDSDTTCDVTLSRPDAKLKDLDDNGGPTLTHLPETDSPAVRAAVQAFCPDDDQRGVTRGIGQCELGSVDIDAPAPAGGGGGTTPKPPEPEDTPPPPRGIENACPKGRVPDDGFEDTAGNTHEASIECIRAYDITRGITDKQYGPSLPVTREQMASFIARLLGAAGAELPQNPRDAFPDDDGSVHEMAINQLAELRIVGGKADGTFGFGESVTRGQLASFIIRAIEHHTGKTIVTTADYFSDDDSSVHEANINKIASLGIAVGNTSGQFRPGDVIRRDQMASFLARALDYLIEQGAASSRFPPSAAAGSGSTTAGPSPTWPPLRLGAIPVF